MSEAPTRGRPNAVQVLGFVAIFAAVLVPTTWLTGTVGPDDPRHLELGAALWRLGGVLVGVFLQVMGRGDALPEPSAVHWTKRCVVLGAVALVAAVGLRFWDLGAPLWFDEIWLLVDTIRQPLGSLVRGFETDNNHPLYSLCAWFSVAILGESAFALRLPAALFGVASIAALWALARRRSPVGQWVLPVALLLVSRHHVSFSQNARAYTALLFLTLLSSHLFLRALDTGSRRAWLGHGLTLGLCVYAHVTGAFVAVGHAAVLAYRWRSPGPAGAPGLRAGVLGLVFGVLSGFWFHALVLPQMLFFFLLRPGRVAVDAAWTNPLWTVSAALESFGLPGSLAWVAAIVGLLCGAYALWVVWRRSPEIALLLVVPTVSIAVVMVALGRNLWPRLFFFQAGFFLIAGVAVGRDILDRFWDWRNTPEGTRETRWRLLSGATIGLAALWLLAVPGVWGPKQDFPGAMQWVEAHAPQGEPVLTVGLARYPYQRYHAPGYVPVESVAEYEAALGAAGRGTVIYTFPIYLLSREPDLWGRVRADGREVARFRGTVGDGDVVVLRVGEGE